MPAPATASPERVRVSAYQARIERTLTDHFYEVPTGEQARGGSEWRLTHVAHTNGYAVCELCGHNPIKRLFFIESNTSGQELMIGSECAINYVGADLVAGYMRRMARDQGRARQRRQRHEQNEARRLQAEAWRAEHPEIVNFVRESTDASGFMADMRVSLERWGSLTEGQVRVVERIRGEREAAAQALPVQPAGNSRTRAAGPDDVPHIYNGTYTVTDQDTAQHMTFQIYTPRRGSLVGTRIVKRMTAYNRFEGFAFVGRDGGLEIWRRFRDDANQPYVRWATRLLHILNEREQDAAGVDTISAAHEWDADAAVGRGRWRIERTRNCRRCNARLTTPTSIHAGIGPECQRRTAEETTAAAQTLPPPAPGSMTFQRLQEAVEGITDQVNRTGSDGRPLFEGLEALPRRRVSNNRRVSNHNRPIEEQGVLLSELGTGEVL